MIAEITLSLHMAVEENAETRCDENARLVALRLPEQKMPFGRFWHAETCMCGQARQKTTRKDGQRVNISSTTSPLKGFESAHQP
jgi:hypothetical protein